MNAPQRLEETALHAYVDGEIDDASRPGVEAWLAEHPEDAARVHAYRAQNAGLHELFDGVLAEPLPETLRAIVAGGRRRRPGAWRRIAAAVALFVAGAAAGWGLHGAGIGPQLGEPRFVRDAVGAHIVFAAEVRHPVEVGADQEAHLVGWLSKRLGSPLKAPRLGGLGYRLMGGRLLPDQGGPAAQFMYEDAAGKRLTVYVRPARKNEDSSFRFVSDRGVSALYWVDAPLACALIAEMPRDKLLPIAHAVYEDIGH